MVAGACARGADGAEPRAPSRRVPLRARLDFSVRFRRARPHTMTCHVTTCDMETRTILATDHVGPFVCVACCRSTVCVLVVIGP